MCKARGLRRFVILVAVVCACGNFLHSSRAAPVYLVNFEAVFDSGFGGLPTTSIKGTYMFELSPATIQNNGCTAMYPMQGARVDLNDALFGTPYGELRVDNNIRLAGPNRYRDSYHAIAPLGGAYAGNFSLIGAGLEFNQIGASPSALNTLDLPTSVEGLAGFGPQDDRHAWLAFQNLNLGQPFTTSAAIQAFSIIQIPEPTPILLCLLGSVLFGRRPRWKLPRPFIEPSLLR